MKFPIYLDYMATTPLEPRVKDKMLPYLANETNFGNAHSDHEYGFKAKAAIENARSQVADTISAKPKEIIWTSGATESNNLAIKGATYFYQRKGKHIITSQTEHKSVIQVCKFLETEGYSVTYLPVQENGLINLNELENAIRNDTILVSIAFVNSEIGVIQDLINIGKIVKPRGIIFHVDAAQAIGKIPIDVQKIPVDLISFSAHKAYGPKGIGALYIRSNPKIRLTPQIHGGGQEFGLRSGTLATHQIVGMGEAFQIAKNEMEQNNQKIKQLRDQFWENIKPLNNVHLNGDGINRVPHNLNISFGGLNTNLITVLKELAVSSGSTCGSNFADPSLTLKALGLSDELANNSIRFSFGNYTTSEEVDFAVKYINEKHQQIYYRRFNTFS